MLSNFKETKVIDLKDLKIAIYLTLQSSTRNFGKIKKKLPIIQVQKKSNLIFAQCEKNNLWVGGKTQPHLSPKS